MAKGVEGYRDVLGAVAVEEMGARRRIPEVPWVVLVVVRERPAEPLTDVGGCLDRQHTWLAMSSCGETEDHWPVVRLVARNDSKESHGESCL